MEQLQVHQTQVDALRAEFGGQGVETAKQFESARGMRARLEAEVAEATDRLERRETGRAALDVRAAEAAAAAREAMEKAQAERAGADREVVATAALLRLKVDQRALLKERLQGVEHEHGLSRRVYEGAQARSLTYRYQMVHFT